MLLVRRDDVGPVAFARLAREALIHEVLGPLALPSDIASTRATRTALVAPLVPERTWLTGLAALWVAGYAPAPDRIDVAGGRSYNRLGMIRSPAPVAYHGGSLEGLPDAGSPRVATVTRACLDALLHSPASDALPATASALRARATSRTRLRRMALTFDVHLHGRRRLVALLDALATL